MERKLEIEWREIEIGKTIKKSGFDKNYFERNCKIAEIKEENIFKS